MNWKDYITNSKTNHVACEKSSIHNLLVWGEWIQLNPIHLSKNDYCGENEFNYIHSIFQKIRLEREEINFTAQTPTHPVIVHWGCPVQGHLCGMSENAFEIFLIVQTKKKAVPYFCFCMRGWSQSATQRRRWLQNCLTLPSGSHSDSATAISTCPRTFPTACSPGATTYGEIVFRLRDQNVYKIVFQKAESKNLWKQIVKYQ